MSTLTILLHPHFPRRSDNSTRHFNMDPRNARFISIFYGWKNLSTKFEKQITTAIQRCYFAVETRVVFTTRPLLPATKKDVLPAHHYNNVIYQFVYHCDLAQHSRSDNLFKTIWQSQRFGNLLGNDLVTTTFWQPFRRYIPKGCQKALSNMFPG